MNVMDFRFGNADTKGRNLGYLFWSSLVSSAFLMLLNKVYLTRFLSTSGDVC